MILKKGQMEMIGLVVIVLLITIAFLFLMQFALSDDSDGRFFARKQLAVSTLTAITLTKVQGCLPKEQQLLEVEEGLLEDCANNPEGGSDYLCNGKYSCAFLQEDLLPQLLENSLGKLNQRYELTSVLVQDPKHPLIKILGKGGKEGCSGRKNIDTSGDFPLNAEAGLVNTILLVCD